MNPQAPLLECVPNFSEGRDPAIINAIATAIRHTPGVQLLHTDISPSANRTVMTFAGPPEAVVEAAYQSIGCAARLIDMQQQAGVHPRIGATDVCPLVPLQGMHMEEAVQWAHELGRRVGAGLGIPVYLYEAAARAPHRSALPDIRKGQYEGFAEKIKLPDWLPDYGPLSFPPASGATVIGARPILVAFNISLDTRDVQKARFIASRIRESGFTETTSDGRKVRVPGLLPKVRAIGWYMEDFGHAQVSMNLLDYQQSSPLEVWEACQALAAEAGTSLIGSELIGLMPESCLLEAGSFVYMRQGQEPPHDRGLLVLEAIKLLKLDAVKPFEPREKVLEYALQRAGLM